MKKAIALLLICCMMMGMTVSATAEAAPAPTIEEILNEYHQRSFENAQGTGASANARSIGGKTLEQETVDALNAAGYEAYNVTAENYDALEASLQTDFAEMGLSPNGTYIITISGEKTSPNDGNIALPAGNDVTLPPHIGGDDTPGQYPAFSYNYNGNTYVMRYVTVTATENTNLGYAHTFELINDTTLADQEAFMSHYLNILSFDDYWSAIATIYSLIVDILPDVPPTTHCSLAYTACCDWTITYTQVYNSNTNKWKASSGVEYVNVQDFINFTYYNAGTFEQIRSAGIQPKIYSQYYNDKAYIKQIAAYAFERNMLLMDTVDEVTFKYNGNTIVTYQRWEEYSSYEPA